MKSRNLLLGLAACLVIGALVLILAKGPGEDSPASDVAAPAGRTVSGAKKASDDPSPSSGSVDGTVRKMEVAPLDDKQRGELLAEIEQLSVTYDAKELPKLEPYLLHPDPEVRKAAMNGMVVLGDSAAAPLLRRAAEKAPTPQEAVALTEAADFMELPEGSFIPKERVKEGTRVPLEGKPGERKPLERKRGE